MFSLRIFLFIVLFNIQILCSEHNNPDFSKEEVSFFAKKDECSGEYMSRKGLLVKRKNAPATVIILHGYGNNKIAVAPFRLFFKKYNCFTFDFRAHGENINDQCCTLGHDEVYDLFGAVDYIKSHPDLYDKPILIWAPSMGASTAIEAQAIDPTLCSGMFLDSPFPSSDDIIRQGVSNMKFCVWGYSFDVPGCGLLEKYAFNCYVQPVLKFLLKQISGLDANKIETFVKPIYPVESIKKVKVPCFFVVCRKDEKILPASVFKVYENHPGPKRFWETEGPDHCGSVFNFPEKYEQKLNDFFDSVLTGDIYDQEREIIMKDAVQEEAHVQ